MRINPLLFETEVPPIPAARTWAARYDRSAGPLIDLSQAVPGYPPHAEFLTRLGKAAADEEAARYGDIVGDMPLREAYASHVSGLYDARIEPANVAVTAGCNQAFVVAMMALAQAGDAVILPTPWYFNHKMALDMLGIEAVALPCRADNRFVPVPEDAKPLLTSRVRAIVLVTPNNPTGAVYPPGLIESFRALCAEHGIALVLDETYRDFIGSDAPPHTCLAASDWAETVVQLYSFSKSYCIPGHRVGALLAGRPVIAEVAKVLDTLQICAPRAPQLVLPWAIPALAEWRAANRHEMLARADAFRSAMSALEGWRLGSIGAYFAYVAPPDAGRSGVEMCETLARERGVLCLPGSYFGAGQEPYLRIAFANVGVSDIAALPARLGMLETAGAAN